MLSFLQPIWLYGIAGIIIPIAIHLWNIKEGRSFPVGSIALLEKSTKKYTRTLRLTQWLLLLLRCLLIILLAFLLAKPVWKQPFSKTEKGWILIEKQNIAETYNHFKSKIDSLLQQGYNFRYFNEGFQQTDLTDALQNEDTSYDNKISYWSLAKKLDEQIPATLPVYVFTSSSLKKFGGTRPELNSDIKWFVYSPSDSANTQIANAWTTNEGNIRVMLVDSKPSGNIFTYEDLPAVQQAKDAYKITFQNSQPFVAYNDETPVAVDTSTMRITLYPGKNKQDAKYLRAAIDAIRQFSKRKIAISVTDDLSAATSRQDWLFWFSEKPVPANIAAQNIFIYEQGKEEDIRSGINADEQNHTPIAVNKIVMPSKFSDNHADILWKDGFGNPLLYKEKNDSANIYHFLSRFNPQWNELAWSNEFPSLLLQLFFNRDMESVDNGYADKRTIDEKQAQPVVSGNLNTVASIQTSVDLTEICWLAAFVIFFIQRLLSFSRKKGAAK